MCKRGKAAGKLGLGEMGRQGASRKLILEPARKGTHREHQQRRKAAPRGQNFPRAYLVVGVGKGHGVGDHLAAGRLALLAKQWADAAEDANVALELLDGVVQLAPGRDENSAAHARSGWTRKNKERPGVDQSRCGEPHRSSSSSCACWRQPSIVSS